MRGAGRAIPSHSRCLCPSFHHWDQGWAGRAGRKHLGLGARGLGAQVPQRSGGFVYKQWGSGSPAPPGGQCGRGGAWPRACSGPPESRYGKVGVGVAPRIGHTQGARPPGAATGGGGGCGSRGRGLRPSNSRLLAPRALGGRGGRTWRRGGGGGSCDSGGAAGTARAGLWICRCLAWVCVLVSGSRVCVPTPRCWRLSPGGVSA